MLQIGYLVLKNQLLDKNFKRGTYFFSKTDVGEKKFLSTFPPLKSGFLTFISNLVTNKESAIIISCRANFRPGQAWCPEPHVITELVAEDSFFSLLVNRSGL